MEMMVENFIHTDERYPEECGTYLVIDYKTENGEVIPTDILEAFYAPILEEYVPVDFKGMYGPGFFTRNPENGKCKIIEPLAWNYRTWEGIE